MNQEQNRREFLKKLATVAGGVVLVPHVVSCGTNPPVVADKVPTAEDVAKETQQEVQAKVDTQTVPTTQPENWDAVAYNKARGNAGAIPETYLDDINGPDGVKKHLGKHLPYIPQLDPAMVPAGYIALMWGDPEKGYAKHPNAPKSESNPEGHWYNWIKIRKAVDGEAEELQSNYSDWPGHVDADNGAYAVFGGGEITADSGKNTVYLAKLPEGLQPGDTVRIWAHCLTHGEYVDFITV